MYLEKIDSPVPTEFATLGWVSQACHTRPDKSGNSRNGTKKFSCALRFRRRPACKFYQMHREVVLPDPRTVGMPSGTRLLPPSLQLEKRRFHLLDQ